VVISRPRGFFVRTRSSEATLEAEGEIIDHHRWKPSLLTVQYQGLTHRYNELHNVPEPFASQFRNLLDHEGVQYVGLVGYVGRHGRLPGLDWAMVVAFISGAIRRSGSLPRSWVWPYPA